MDFIEVRYIAVPKSRCTRGLSEKAVRKHLKKHGWLIWKGSYLDIALEDEIGSFKYHSRHYLKLQKLLIEKIGFAEFRKLVWYCKENHGTTDFITYHPIKKSVEFAEVKLGNESIKDNQIAFLFRISKCFTPVIYRVHNSRNITKLIKIKEQDERNLRELTSVKEQIIPLTRFKKC